MVVVCGGGCGVWVFGVGFELCVGFELGADGVQDRIEYVGLHWWNSGMWLSRSWKPTEGGGQSTSKLMGVTSMLVNTRKLMHGH